MMKSSHATTSSSKSQSRYSAGRSDSFETINRVDRAPDTSDDDAQEDWDMLAHVPKRKLARSAGLGSSISTARQYIWDFVNSNTGLLLIVASQLFFALMNLGVKFLTGLAQPVPTFELIATRMAVTWICCVGWMKWQQVPYPIIGPPEVRHLLILRGVTGFFGLFGVYYSLQFLSLSDATAITFLVPSTIAIAAFLLLHEPLRFREVLAGLFALVGVLLIARPEFIFGKSESDSTVEKGTSGQRLGAVGVALLGVLGGTGALITIRHIKTRAHPMHSISYFSAWCVIVATVGSFVMKTSWVLPTDPLWSLGLLGIGIAGFAGQVFLTMGLQRETAGRASIGLYVQIIYTTVLERLFFHHTPSVLSIIGTCIIMSSAIYIAATKQNKSSESPPPSNAEYIDQDATPGGSPSHISRSLPLLPTTLLSNEDNYVRQNPSSMSRSKSPTRSKGGKDYVALPAEDDLGPSSGVAEEMGTFSHASNSHLRPQSFGDERGGNVSSLWSPVSPFSAKIGE